MSPKQKKIAAKAPPRNKIDGKDFAVLKAEKAKGRGKGLQDEKMKPGKVRKADKGKMIKSDPTKAVNPMDKGMQKRMAERALRAARATKIGKIALGVAAVGLGAKEFLKKKIRDNEKKAKAKKKMGGGLMAATKKLKSQGKMGGGMMQRPMMAMGYDTGDLASAENVYKKIKAQGRKKAAREALERMEKRRKKRSGELPVIPTPRLGNKPKGLGGIGGSIPGRMGRPPAPRVSPRLAGPQMSTGGSVKVKVKLGRNKPTKLF